MTKFLKVFKIFPVFLAISSFSYEFNYLARSPEGLLMGDAYTTLATGAFSLFYNPALAARNKLFAFYPIPVSLGATDFVTETDKFDDLDTDETSTLADAVIGTPLHANAGIFPTIKLGWFTFTPFANATTNAVIYDNVHPVIDIDYRLDRGFATGLGYERSKGNGSWAFGVATKYINRRGIFGQFDVFGKEFSDVVSSDGSEIDAITEGLGYTEGKGWGFDAGVDYRYTKGPGTWALGFSALDIGNTTLTKTSGDGELPDQFMSLNLGTSFSFDTPLLSWTLSADLHPINANIDTLQKLHLGAKVGIPLLDVMVGYNGGYLSYGAGVRLFPFRLYLGFYDKEVGENVGDLRSDRLVAYISLLDFTIDKP